MPELWFKELTQTVWVYKLKGCGQYYKRHNKGSWAASSVGVSGKEIITDDITEATQFIELPSEMPHLHNRLRGGRYIQIKITTKYEVLK